MGIPDGTEDRPSGSIPGRPGEEIGDKAGDFVIWFAATVVFAVAAGIAVAGLYLLAWAILH